MGAVALAHTAPYTIHDLLDMPDDGSRYEVFDGALLVSPAPTGDHQRAADRLGRILDDAAPDGVEVITAVAVRCGDDSTGPVPDVVVARTNEDTIGRFIDARDVLAVVEIVSPGSRRQDRVTKPDVYAGCGIPVYWRVELDPFPGQGIEQLPVVVVQELRDATYRQTACLSAGTIGSVTLPFPVEFDPAVLVGRRRRS